LTSNIGTTSIYYPLRARIDVDLVH
jgi:hypothetical protein